MAAMCTKVYKQHLKVDETYNVKIRHTIKVRSMVSHNTGKLCFPFFYDAKHIF
jgi:hypothetical protein